MPQHKNMFGIFYIKTQDTTKNKVAEAINEKNLI